MSFRDTLLQRLSPLDARLRVDEVSAIATRLQREDASGGDSARERASLYGWLTEGDAEVAALEEDLEHVAEAHMRDGDCAHLVGLLHRQAGGRASWRDRWATRSTLGVGVLRERTAARVEAVGIREELLLKVLTGCLDADDPIHAVVVDRLENARRWATRKAAAEVLLVHARARSAAGLAPEATLTRRVRVVADRAGEHPWVRDACDAWLAEVAPEDTRQRLAASLADLDTARPSRTGFLLRRLRVERYARMFPESAPQVLAPSLEDPSEHVAIGVVECLCALTSPHAGSALRLAATAARPRVRLATAEHLGRAAGRHAPVALLDLVTARLAEETDGAVLRTWARAASRVALAHPALAHALADALDVAVARDVSGESAGAAAAARATCRRIADAATAALHAALSARLPEVRPGTSRRFSWAELGRTQAVDEDLLGRVLAELAREDFGLWAAPDARGVRIWRGDDFRVRPWRVLHELRNPANNKRAGGNHVVGRVIHGTVRAPPGRMAEVTATTVPGERTVVDREASWVPTLPTVDDLLDIGDGARVYSAFGRTTLTPPSERTRRGLLAARLTAGYARLARRRSMSLAADEASERGAFVRDVERELGVGIAFRPDGSAPGRITEVAGTATFGVTGGLVDAVVAPTRASQPALAVFASLLLGGMLVEGWVRRERIRAARDALPLVIGGWGTRGKSGTERIKAALFHGLGHAVFVKTTGCEAMFIQATPGVVAREIFIYRPHDKSSIWEQAAMLRQAAGMRARVMLWECMALRPAFVELLEQDWMRDDLVTITNAFPDHEDVQGPAGHDIATTISSFVPKQSVAFTSEVEFLPVLRERARERATELQSVDPVEAELWGADLLALFPYQEHPRNIALVARLAEHLGIDRHLAVVTMADGVVPDLGVLRIYPEVCVRGRSLRFINGMSANERTGCMANWRRTGCDAILPDTEPDSAIVVVVNNRADRVARSEVFARIIVQDLSADAFVLIGTNLTGLHGYILVALDRELEVLRLQPEGVSADQALERLAQAFGRLRIGRPGWGLAHGHALVAARGAGRRLVDSEGLRREVGRWLEDATHDGDRLDVAKMLERLRTDGALRAAWDRATSEAASIEGGPAEVLGHASADQAFTGWVERLADLVIHARCRRRLQAGTLDDTTFRALYKERFLRSLRPIEDRYATGDQIIVTAADAVMAGTRVTLMGVQNIKGTGLDFAYRWVALGQVAGLLERASSTSGPERVVSLRTLANFDDHGLVDAGVAALVLAAPLVDETSEEAALREGVLQRVREIRARRERGLTERQARRWWMGVLDAFELVIDPLDAVRRAWVANRTMARLREHTISLPDAASVMQELYARQKGGWLVKWAMRQESGAHR